MAGIIIFDIPKDKPSLRVKVNRALKEASSVKIQDSVWRSENLDALIKIALMIRNEGGAARVLEERVII